MAEVKQKYRFWLPMSAVLFGYFSVLLLGMDQTRGKYGPLHENWPVGSSIQNLSSYCNPSSLDDKAMDELLFKVLQRPVTRFSRIQVAALDELLRRRLHFVSFLVPFDRARKPNHADKVMQRLVRVCDDEARLKRLTRSFMADPRFPKTRLTPNAYKFLMRAGPRDERLVTKVARTAFSSAPVYWRQQSRRLRDMRSLARVTLSEFARSSVQWPPRLGIKRRIWAEKAYSMSHTHDELGTSAAQVAVALAKGHTQKKALKKVAQMLGNILHELKHYEPAEGYTTWRDRKQSGRLRARFKELAYALAFAGPQADPYLSPLVQLVKKDTPKRRPIGRGAAERQGWACNVAAKIGGPQAKTVSASPVCSAWRAYQPRRVSLPQKTF